MTVPMADLGATWDRRLRAREARMPSGCRCGRVSWVVDVDAAADGCGDGAEVAVV